jgi:hypothetical protein
LRLSAEARNASGATIGAALRLAPIIGTLQMKTAAAPNVITDLRILSPQGLMSECNAGPDCLFLK